MKTAEAVAWLEDVLALYAKLGRRDTEDFGFEFFEPATDVMRWLAEADAAMQSVLPPSHALCARWRAVIELRPSVATRATNVEAAYSFLGTALALFQSGRVASLLDGVRAETVVEVLDQAEQLVREKATVPAAVLAGGALETHLRHLCDRHGLLGGLVGPGSIEKYRGLLDQARNAGAEIISKGDAKQVTAWADDRNVAAHDPTKFTKNLDAVRLMIDGIRQFVARASA
ncbi:MAG: hypothetical protein K8H88_05100 [Sandaracinaceae bacterium]|nr:hypothetical protein [Sandaracinaceae bacterium]